MAQAKQRGAYLANWTELALFIKREAGWKCVRCSKPHDRASGYLLTVHHFDGDKCNNERWNLMALCQRCHLSIQARVDPDNPWMGPYSPWSYPYIAGFFASGAGVEPPNYSLRRWIKEYEAAIGTWPQWAKRAESVGLKPGGE